MATNEQFRYADHLSLPVPSGTVSGDPVRVGILNGVAQTHRGEGGNESTYATVWLNGSHTFTVVGAVDEVGQSIYFADGALSSAEGGALFGVALATQAGDGDLPVKIIPTSPAPASAA